MFENPNEERSPKELIEGLYKAFESFRRKMEDPSYIQIEGAIHQLMEKQDSMKADISDLKSKLLNPYDGVIVETQKNTEFRLQQEDLDKELEKMRDEHKELIMWKRNITKISWAVFTALIGIIAFIISRIIEGTHK